MRTYIASILIILLLLVSEKSFAQCPIDENTFRAGGTYSGDCALQVDASVTITGIVNWTSGTLTLTGGPGNIQVSNGAVLNIQGGEITTIDDGDIFPDGVADGQITISNGGTINLSPGAELTWALILTVNGTFNAAGRAESLLGRFSIGSTGVVHIPYGGELTTPGTGDSDIQGSLTVEGSLSTVGDIEINGGSVTVADNATLTTGADLFVYGGGSFQVDPLGSAAVAGRVANADDNPSFPTISGTGSIEVGGSLLVGTHLSIYNTTPNSELSGLSGGEITVSGSFSDAECPSYAEGAYTFCDCTGGGDPCSAVLPVELISFTAEQQASTISLNWTTATELNNDYFSIERFNDLDQLSSIASIPGKGTSVQLNNYNFVDTAPLLGINYYRLKQTDFNGLYSYSKIVKVDFILAENKLLVYPNPSTGKLVSINGRGFSPLTNLAVSIRSANGTACFFENAVTDESGGFSKTIDVSQIPSGIYIISAGRLNTKFVK